MRREKVFTQIPEGYYHRRLNNGCSATCYLTDFGKVFKEYPEEYEYLRELEYLTYYQSEHFAFPEEFIFLLEEERKSLRGYLMKYIEGTSIRTLEDTTKLRDFVNALNEFEREMLRLTTQGLIFNDLNQDNLIYTPDKRIKAIDTDLYDVTSDDDFGNMCKRNLKELAATIIAEFACGNRFKSNYMSECVEKCGAYGILRSSSLLEILAEESEKETKETVETVGELKQVLKLLKK
ncbi:MAG: hypothetical protein SPI44_05570 [Bacilli bacterium]|nr:hypothetical protein [Bacilli bacterium]